jgi:hypothetical protein
MDFSDRVSLPTAWATSQWIVAEIAVTLQDSDSADVYRGSDNCIVDLKDNVTSSTVLAYGDTAPNALRALPGLASDIFIMNDRSPQMSLSGPANAVKQALANVRVSCATAAGLAGKYVRVGAVPTESPATIDGSTANGALFYVFSTNHYYRYWKDTTTTIASNYTRIGEMIDYAATQTITVNGSDVNVSGAARPAGWVATLEERDEILLTNAVGVAANGPMIGLTDVGTDSANQGAYLSGGTYRVQTNGKSWAWNAAWGTAPTGTSNCTTLEGNYRWIGPDAWCKRVPTLNTFDATTKSNTRFWGYNTGTAQWEPWVDVPEYTVASAAISSNVVTVTTTAAHGYAANDQVRVSGVADSVNGWRTVLATPSSTTFTFAATAADASVTPSAGQVTKQITNASELDMTSNNVTQGASDFNGSAVWHSWHIASNYIDEPNVSGDFVYMGYGGAYWDDALPADGVERDGQRLGNQTRRYMFIEFCSGRSTEFTCAPPDSAVASTLLAYGQTITFANPGNHTASFTISPAPSTTSGLPVTLTSTTPSVCMLSGLTVTKVTNGKCTLVATQAGNGTYLAAPPVTRSIAFTNNFTLNVTNGLVQNYTSSLASFNVGPVTFVNPPVNVTVDVTLTDTADVAVAASDAFRLDVGTWDTANSVVNAGTATEVQITGDRSTQVSLTGPQAAVQAVLESVRIYRNGQSTLGVNGVTRQIKVTGTEGVPGVVWSAELKHYYRLATRTTSDGLGSVNDCSSSPCQTRHFVRWSTARIDAASASNNITVNGATYKGYLAAITTKAEFDFIRTKVAQIGGVLRPAWVGGSDFETEGIWKWVAGPEALAQGGDQAFTTNDRLDVTKYDGAQFFGPVFDGPSVNSGSVSLGDTSASLRRDVCRDRGARGTCDTSTTYVRWSPGNASYRYDWDGSGTEISGAQGGDGAYAPQPDNWGASNDETDGSIGEDGLIMNWCASSSSSLNAAITPVDLYGTGSANHYCTPGWNDLAHNNVDTSTDMSDWALTQGTTQYLIEYCGYDDDVPCDAPSNAVATVSFQVQDDSTQLQWTIAGRQSAVPTAGGVADASCTTGTAAVREDSRYRILTLTAPASGNGSCTWTAPSGVTQVEVLAVGGGGGGGYDAGGGGGGGATAYHSSLTESSLSITVGGGGGVSSSGATWAAKRGTAGTTTTVASGSVTMSAGGGAGGNGCSWSGNPAQFCGSGGNSNTGGAGGTATGGTRNGSGGTGGNGVWTSGSVASNNRTLPTNGADGRQNQIIYALNSYGGGGGGSGASLTPGSGGAGGGAAGTTSNGAPAAATASTGGGGGGGNGPGSSGGSGVVILRYSTDLIAQAGATTVNVSFTGANSVNNVGTLKRQWASLTDSTCGTTWTTEAANINSLPDNSSLTGGRCYRWTYDSGLATGAIAPTDTASFSPTANLTSPVLKVPLQPSLIAPDTILVDPRTSAVPLSGITVSGPERVRFCVYESSESTLSGIGTPASNTRVTFDAGTVGSADSTFTLTGSSADVTGDLSDVITIQGSRAIAQSALNSIIVHRTVGRFGTSSYLLIRAIPVIDGASSMCTANPNGLAPAASSTVMVRVKPVGIELRETLTITLVAGRL